ALMDIFTRAMEQDELETLEYVQSALPADLRDELDTLLADEWYELRPRLRLGLSADLLIVASQSERFSGVIDMSAELVEKALRLRIQRLQRERQELVFLEMDGDGDYQTSIMLSILAKRLIDTELNRRSQLLRQ